MTVSVALLRGINVGRAKRVSMPALRDTFGALGYTEVITVLQSGNVVFTGGPHAPDAAQMEAAISRELGVQASVLVISAAELAAIAEENPLTAVANDPSRLLVSFVAEPGVLGTVRSPDQAVLGLEQMHVGKRAIYQWLPEGVLATRVPPGFWRGIGCVVTARNWRTVLRLVDLAQGAGSVASADTTASS